MRLPFTGAFLTLGSARSLQFVPTVQGQPPPVRRVLPATPGKAVDISPPSKPQRLKKQETCETSPLSSQDDSLDAGIRQRLQRIAAEISARLVGYEGRKPPPVSSLHPPTQHCHSSPTM